MKYFSILTSLLTLIALGSCDEGDACPAVGAAFCGSDGITYGNSLLDECLPYDRVQKYSTHLGYPKLQF